LHDGIEGDIYLGGLSANEREKLRGAHPNLADQITTLST